MKETLRQWINETDLPVLLFTIDELCHERYESDSKRLIGMRQARGWNGDEGPEERKLHDIALAFFIAGPKNRAEAFLEHMKTAGMSDAELDARERREKIDDLRQRLTQEEAILAKADGVVA